MISDKKHYWHDLRTIRLFYFFDNRFEGGGIGENEVGQDFTVEIDIGNFELGDEFGVRQIVLGQSGVDTHNPEAPEVALAKAASGIGVLAGMKIGLFGDFVEPAFGHPHPFGAGQDLVVTVFSGKSGFNAHWLLSISDQVGNQ